MFEDSNSLVLMQDSWANTFFCGGSRFRRCYFYCSIKLYRLRYVGMVLISHRYSYTVKHSNVYSSVSLTPRRTKISLRFPLFKHLFFVFLVQCISNIHVPHIFFIMIITLYFMKPEAKTYNLSESAVASQC